MFVGSVPKECIEQALRVVDVASWGDVAVCCSGSFRVDKTLALRGVNVHSNDVSLLSSAVGEYLLGRDLDFELTGPLEALGPASKSLRGVKRVALVGIALAMSAYTRDNLYSKRHFDHYVANLDAYIERGAEKLAKHLEGLKIASYFAGDFREHARRAAERGYGVLGFPPTYKKGYERIFKVLNASARWNEPSYDIWDPKEIGAWLGELRDSGVRHCVFSDQLVDGFKPVCSFRKDRARTVYFYGSTDKSSLRNRPQHATPFRYTPMDPAKLRRESKVEIITATGQMMNFLKDKYLKAGLGHSAGTSNFIVLVDGMLAGGIIYTSPSTWSTPMRDHSCMYIQCDFATSSERRLSKLITLLSTCRAIVRVVEREYFLRVKSVETTAFTDKPVSMKYRGIFDLTARNPGRLQYASKVREDGIQELYRLWFDRHAQRADRDAPRDAIRGA